MAVAGMIYLSCSPSEERIQPKLGKIIESVYASVVIMPDSMYALHSAVSGYVSKLHVQEGDRVSKGQALITIESDLSNLVLSNAKLAVELAQENLNGHSSPLDELTKEIEVARLSHINDSINYLRHQRLWKQNIGTANNFEKQKLAYKVSSEHLSLLKVKYQRTQYQLENTLTQAMNNYEKSKVSSRYYTIKSEIDGRAYQLSKVYGEQVTPQQPVAMVGSYERFIIQMEVDEVDISNIMLNQTAIIAIDAYPDEFYKAVIHKILPNKRQDTQTFVVEAIFSKAPPRLYAGLSGEANIIIGERVSAILIPTSYCIQDSLVQTDQGLVTIKTGLKSIEYIEVLSGIDTTTFIKKP